MLVFFQWFYAGRARRVIQQHVPGDRAQVRPQAGIWIPFGEPAPLPQRTKIVPPQLEPHLLNEIVEIVSRRPTLSGQNRPQEGVMTPHKAFKRVLPAVSAKSSETIIEAKDLKGELDVAQHVVGAPVYAIRETNRQGT
jgi:hypothetical protein